MNRTKKENDETKSVFCNYLILLIFPNKLTIFFPIFQSNSSVSIHVLWFDKYSPATSLLGEYSMSKYELIIVKAVQSRKGVD